MDININALILDKKDNVAVVLETLRNGNFLSLQEGREKFKVLGTIPYGHKVAIDLISKGNKVIKYGECMGIATEDIKVGEHVHESNVRGLTEEDKNMQKEEADFENV